MARMVANRRHRRSTKGEVKFKKMRIGTCPFAAKNWSSLYCNWGLYLPSKLSAIDEKFTIPQASRGEENLLRLFGRIKSAAMESRWARFVVN
jgi:hypothetical protein